MERNFAYSTLQIKSVDAERRVITGIATTPTTDRMGDIVEPKGAEFQLPIPFLWQHDSRQPIGEVTKARVTTEGIEVEVHLANLEEPGKLKDRLDEAWQSIKTGLVKGLSIGFSATEFSRIESGLRFIKWLWLELSAVTIPANADCSITAIKSADEAARRALSGSGSVHRRAVRLDTRPGVPGDNPPETQGQPTMKTVQEQIADLVKSRTVKATRMDEIMTTARDEGRSTDEKEAEEFDTLASEVKTLDADMKRLETLASVSVARAVPVVPAAGRGEGAVEIPNSGYVRTERRTAKGTAYTRFVMAMAASKGNLMQAERIAQELIKSGRWADTPEVMEVIKTATNAGTTSSTTWAAPLVQYNDMASEFIELLRPETILGKLDGVRRVPFNIRIPRQTGGTSGTFVGEGSPTPVQALAFDNITMPWAKASTIVVITLELARFSDPNAEALVRNDIIAGVAQYLDKRLIDPSYPGVANVSPASLTYGITARQASGVTLAAIDADVRNVFQSFATNEVALTQGVWVMSASQAITLSLLRTSVDTPAFPGLSVKGGTWYGLPVIVSNNAVSSGSPGESQITLIAQNEVLLADDNQMEIDVSSEASVQMNDAPSGGAQSLVSLWQNGLLGVKVNRWIYWTKRRSTAVAQIEQAQRYGS
jgi:HK97 family phage major capsid protein/HK97 family phage prohead protease